jgi:hypothetical protein
MLPKSRFVIPPEKMEILRQIARKANEAVGISGIPTVTAEELKERMGKKGINPDDLIFQRELMRMRYGDQEDK